MTVFPSQALFPTDLVFRLPVSVPISCGDFFSVPHNPRSLVWKNEGLGSPRKGSVRLVGRADRELHWTAIRLAVWGAPGVGTELSSTPCFSCGAKVQPRGQSPSNLSTSGVHRLAAAQFSGCSPWVSPPRPPRPHVAFWALPRGHSPHRLVTDPPISERSRRFR